MQSRSSSPKCLAAIAVFAFALFLFPTLAFASTADASDNAGTIGAQATAQGSLVAGDTGLAAQGGGSYTYTSITTNKTYAHTFLKYNAVCYRFTSGGGKLKLVVNNKVKKGFMVFGVWLGASDPTFNMKYLKQGAVNKGKNTFNLGTIKSGTVVNIALTSGMVGKTEKCTFTVKGNAAGGSSSGANQGASQKAKNTKIKLKKSNTKITVKDVKYKDGKACKPKVKVKLDGKKLKKGTDYTVKYSNNKEIGTAKVKVKGKGKYKGTVTKSFKIKPKGNVYVLIYGGAKNGELSSTRDVKLMETVFKSANVPGYSLKNSNIKVHNYNDFSRKQFDSDLGKTFANSTSNDVCFIYLCTHGAGQDLGWYQDYKTMEVKKKIRGIGISASEGVYGYLEMLETIGKKTKGQIVFLTESCFSGGFVEAAPNCSARNRISILSAASKELSSNNTFSLYGNRLADNTGATIAYFVYGDSTVGCYTSALAQGLGYSKKSIEQKAFERLVSAKLPADKNKDGKVTVKELYSYVQSNKEIKSTGQSPQYYAANDSLALFR